MGGYFQIPCAAMEDLSLSVCAKVLYVVLCRNYNLYGGNNFVLKNYQLEEQCNMSSKTIVKAKNELITAGYIKTKVIRPQPEEARVTHYELVKYIECLQ